MTDRILRGNVFKSDRFLDLPRNTHRLAFLALIPKADPLGNMEAGDGALWRIWREPCALIDRIAVPEILERLVASDLVRLYESEAKRFLHIPRYRQRLRYLGRLNPLSPWTTEQENQRVTGKSPGAHPAITRCAPAEVEVEVEVEVKKIKNKVVPNPVDSTHRASQVKTVLDNLNVKNKPLPSHLSREEQIAYVAEQTRKKNK